MNTYDVIKALCDEKGIAVTALEKELGFGRGSIGKIKNGGSMSVNRLQKVADYFGVDLRYFSDRVEPRKFQTVSLFSGSAAKDMLIRTMEKALREMFSDTEFNLIALFRQLNPEGQNKLLEYLMDLLDMPKYTAQTDADK